MPDPERGSLDWLYSNSQISTEAQSMGLRCCPATGANTNLDIIIELVLPPSGSVV